MLKCTRLPTPLTDSASVLELHTALHPLLELYVLSKVREAEQDHQTASMMRREFDAAIKSMAQQSQLKGLRQGLQVRLHEPSPYLYGGRVFLP